VGIPHGVGRGLRDGWGAAVTGVGDADWLLWPLAFQGTAEDARGILVVVSATMITVTGLVFAHHRCPTDRRGQYSPRLPRNVMRDRGTQVVLGAFAYSTAGLHTVGIQRAGGEAFMSRLAVSGSLVLGLVRAGLLIYFIHHLARSIQIDAIMGQVEREARWVIDGLYPNGSGYLDRSSAAPTHRPRPPFCRPAAPATVKLSSPSPSSGRPRARTWSSGWPDRSATTSLRARR
jgi:uncharacterized membrane protein